MSSVMSNQLKGLHDRLLQDKPENATHSTDECPLCALESIDNGGTDVDDQPEGGSMSADKTYTDDDLKAAVDKAVAETTSEVSELKAKLSELENSQQQSEIDKAVADVKAESEAAVKELQEKLDAAVLEVQTEKKAREDLEGSIAAEKQAAEEAAALEARKEQRLVQVKEVASFPDDYLTANAERWAKLPDDEFAKLIEDWKVIASKTDATPPATTAMTASREEGGNQPRSALSTLREIRSELVGPKSL